MVSSAAAAVGADDVDASCLGVATTHSGGCYAIESPKGGSDSARSSQLKAWAVAAGLWRSVSALNECERLPRISESRTSS